MTPGGHVARPLVEPGMLKGNKSDVDHQLQARIVWGRSKPSIAIKAELRGTQKNAEALAVVDSGAEGTIINRKFVRKHHIRKIVTPWEIDLINANDTISTMNTRVKIQMTIGTYPHQHKEELSFYVGNIGSHNILLGYDWLDAHNPSIDWQEYKLEMNRCPGKCNQHTPTTVWGIKKQSDKHLPQKTRTLWSKEEEEDNYSPIEEIIATRAILDTEDTPAAEHKPTKRQAKQTAIDKRNNSFHWSCQRWSMFYAKLGMSVCSAKTGLPTKAANTAQRLAQQVAADKPKKTKEELVPKHLHKWLDIFDEQKSNQFPPSRPWDHAIEMEEGWTPSDCKLYLLSPGERNSLDEWVDNQLKKGYIQPSKSPQASLFFFTGKKDGKLRPIQDY
jgi:hypothetical protein